MLISGMTPQLRTRDLALTIRFFTEKVGLALDFRYSDFDARIRAADQLFHLKLVDDTDLSIAYVRDGGHFHLYLNTSDVDALAFRLESKGVRLHQEPRDTEWGTREFVFHDGNTPRKCELQVLQNGRWVTESSTSLLLWNFFARKTQRAYDTLPPR